MINKFSKNKILNYDLLCFLVVLMGFAFPSRGIAQNIGFVEIQGKIKHNTEDLDSVLVILLEGRDTISTQITGADGKFRLKLPLNKYYIIKFTKTSFASKKIAVNTKIPGGKEDNLWRTQTGIKLFESLPGIDYKALNEPVSIIKFKNDELGGFFTFDKTYAQRKDVEVRAIEQNINQKIQAENQIENEIKNLSDEAMKRLGLVDIDQSKEKADSILINAQKKAVKLENNANLTAKEILNNANLNAGKEAEKIIQRAIEIADSILKKARADADKIIRGADSLYLISLSSKNKHKDSLFAEEIISPSILELNYKNELEKIKDNNSRLVNELKKGRKITNLEFSDSDLLAFENDLNKKENELGILKKQINKVKINLEIEKLKAKTYEDSLRIQRQEKIIESIEREITKAVLEIKNARKIIMEQKYQIKQQRTVIYFTIGALFVAVLIMLIIYSYYKQKKKTNKILRKQKNKIEEQNKNILQGLNYAKRLQKAILPSNREVKRLLDKSFVLFKPKELVSGDFYWIEHVDNRIFLSVVDCTGHGVPGAFMSIIGHNGLTQTINDYNLRNPANILDKLDYLVTEVLHSHENTNVKDGMDIALCSIDLQQKKLEFAGAFNPIYLIRKHTAGFFVDGVSKEPEEVSENYHLYTIKGDSQPIGPYDFKQHFTNHLIELQEGDTFYLFTDGFTDQFGGPDGKKFKHKNLRELLLSIQENSPDVQKNILNKAIEDWKGDYEQIDDICIIGISV